MSEVLLRDDNGAITSLTLNIPNKLNILSEELLEALQQELDAIANDQAVRVVILKGAGKAFCAGHDLKQMTAARENADGGAEYYKNLFNQCANVMLSIAKMPQPIIAQAHGIATAAGCQLVASCDMAVAAEGTKFGVNGVNIGLFCSTPMVALTRKIPRKKAFEMLTTGEFISAEQARELGLINHVVDLSELENKTIELATKVADKLGAAVKIGKQAFYKQIEMPINQAYDYTGEVMVENMLNAQTEKGIQSFLKKEHPKWDQ